MLSSTHRPTARWGSRERLQWWVHGLPITDGAGLGASSPAALEGRGQSGCRQLTCGQGVLQELGSGHRPAERWVLVSSPPAQGEGVDVGRAARPPTASCHTPRLHWRKRWGELPRSLPVVLQSAANLPLSLNLSMSLGGRDCHPISQVGKLRLEGPPAISSCLAHSWVSVLGPGSPEWEDAGRTGSSVLLSGTSEAGGVWR